MSYNTPLSPNYSFPIADGSAGQVPQTDGSGVVTWETIPGTGTVDTITSSNANIGVDSTDVANPVLTLSDNPLVNSISTGNFGISCLDGNGDFYITWGLAENLTGNKTLSFVINDANRTINLSGDLTTSGANDLTLTTTGATNVTLPTTGTLTAIPTNGIITPVSTPTYIGEFYVDTLAQKLYFSVGTSSAADWIAAN